MLEVWLLQQGRCHAVWEERRAYVREGRGGRALAVKVQPLGRAATTSQRTRTGRVWREQSPRVPPRAVPALDMRVTTMEQTGKFRTR